jgi:uncharacterized membrane protein YdbT with pleckstrin-like domain
VAFPEDSLTEDEKVVLHLHPHWKAIILPVFWTVLLIAAVVVAWIFLPEGSAANIGLLVIGVVALALFFWLAFAPFIVWRSTHFVFTNERVLLREGVFSREQRDIPLTRVNDVSSKQSLLERLLGCGTLTVESAGERGQSVLKDIPKVVAVQKAVYQLVEADHERRTLDGEEMRQIMRERGADEPPAK